MWESSGVPPVTSPLSGLDRPDFGGDGEVS